MLLKSPALVLPNYHGAGEVFKSLTVSGSAGQTNCNGNAALPPSLIKSIEPGLVDFFLSLLGFKMLQTRTAGRGIPTLDKPTFTLLNFSPWEVAVDSLSVVWTTVSQL